MAISYISTEYISRSIVMQMKNDATSNGETDFSNLKGKVLQTETGAIDIYHFLHCYLIGYASLLQLHPANSK